MMLTRNRRIGVLMSAVLALTLAACGGGGEAPQTMTPAPSSSATVPAGDFPATVETKFGDVVIEEAPTRVVALGWGDAETALALGFQPIGASDWLGFGGEGVGPWAEGLYDNAPEMIATLEPDFEAIAALEPDLILDTKSSGDQARYERLSQIATTIGVPVGGDTYLTSTDQQLEMIATAFGVPEKGMQLSADIDSAFATVRSEHPDWAGKTVAAATRTSEGWGAYIQGSERVSFLEDLGFIQSPKIADLKTSDSGFTVNISAEQLDLLNSDLIVAFPIWIETSEITADPQWKAIPAVKDGRAVVIDGDIAQAYSLGTTLAMQFALDQLVPKIATALKK